MISNKHWTKEKIECSLIKLLIETNCCEIINLDRKNVCVEKSDFILRDRIHTAGVEVTQALDENLERQQKHPIDALKLV